MDSLALSLRKLTQIKSGDLLENVVTAERLSAIQDAILLMAKGDHVKTSGGILKTAFSSSFILKGQRADDILAEDICELKMTDANIGDGQYAVTFRWGRIANRQPTGFDTEGMIDPLPVADDGEIHYFYAKCTANLVTLAWTNAEIVEALPGVVATSTSTVVHYLLGTAQVVGGALSLSDPACGPVWPRLCDLASEYSYS